MLVLQFLRFSANSAYFTKILSQADMASLLDGSVSASHSAAYEKLAPYPPGLNAHSAADRFGVYALRLLHLHNLLFILHFVVDLLSLHVTGTVDKPKDKLNKDEQPYGSFTTYCLAGVLFKLVLSFLRFQSFSQSSFYWQ